MPISSGYTDIAIGCAVLIGVELPENFRLPFLARSFADHWRRWHISLSNWFRDYVFTPLVIHLAPRVFRSKTRALQLRLAPILTGVILVVTMVLIGLWHGLGWNYAWWGFYNGVLVALSPALLRLFRRLKLANSFLMILLTFYLTTIGRILTFPRPARSLKNLLQELHPVSFKAFSVSSRGTESFLGAPESEFRASADSHFCLSRLDHSACHRLCAHREKMA